MSSVAVADAVADAVAVVCDVLRANVAPAHNITKRRNMGKYGFVSTILVLGARSAMPSNR